MSGHFAQALVTPEVTTRLEVQCQNSNFSTCIVELLTFFKDTYKNVFKMALPPLHDPCAVAYLLDPARFVTERMRVDVETQTESCIGYAL